MSTENIETQIPAGEPQVAQPAVAPGEGPVGGTSEAPQAAAVSAPAAPSYEESRARYETLLASAKNGTGLSDEDLEFAEYWESKGQYETSPQPGDGGEQKPATATVDPVIAQVLEKVGAKSVDELPDKVQGLIQAMGKQGNDLGQRAKQLEEQNLGMQMLMADLAKGDPFAIQFARENGIPVPPALLQQQSLPAPQEPAKKFTLEALGIRKEEVLDENLLGGIEKLVDHLNALDARLESSGQLAQQARAQVEQHSRIQQVHTAAFNKVSQFVAQNPHYLGANDPKVLEDVYFGRDPVAALERVPELRNLLSFADSSGLSHLSLPEIEAIYRVRNPGSVPHAPQHNAAQQAVQAVQQQRVADIPQPRNVSQMAAPPVVDGNLGYTDAQIKAFRDGKVDIPDGWFVNGQPVLAKIPVALHDIV